MKKELPACPVEITMSLIGEKWKILIVHDLLTRNETFWRIESVCYWYYAKSFNKQFKANGAFWLSSSKSICRSSTQSWIFFNWNWLEFEANFRFYGNLGQSISKKILLRKLRNIFLFFNQFTRIRFSVYCKVYKQLFLPIFHASI